MEWKEEAEVLGEEEGEAGGGGREMLQFETVFQNNAIGRNSVRCCGMIACMVLRVLYNRSPQRSERSSLPPALGLSPRQVCHLPDPVSPCLC